MMFDELKERHLQGEYESIFSEIINTKYFGKVINKYDVRELVVSAFYYGAFNNSLPISKERIFDGR